MSETIQILQLGTKDWNECYDLPETMELTCFECFTETTKVIYDLVFVERKIKEEELPFLHKAVKAHTVYMVEGTTFNETANLFGKMKKGKIIAKEELPEFFRTEARNYFPKPYGEKFGIGNIAIVQSFRGSVAWHGKYCVSLEGAYGETLTQACYWRTNIPVFQGQAIELWLEYKKDPEVEIALSVTQFVNGSISGVQQSWYFSEEELDDIVLLDNQMASGPIFVSLLAKGSGKLDVIALHDRYSRRGHGLFLPGGERYVTADREEIFYYFDPGDLKPPLTVYFSGYKTMQGFEGYYMMKKMGCPFLLIAEPRLDGGSFYMGSKEYEAAMVDIIKKHMKELGFDNRQVILSGLSMGTFGAMYYGCDILPYAMILGKPLASIGDVADNERLHRPGGFPTSLDVVQYLTGGTRQENIEQLNRRFWDKFDAAPWENSKFVVAYMIEDDYDSKAYNRLISHVKTNGVQVYGKGIHGRHNDESFAINAWFRGQYNKILQEDFFRKAE